MRTGEEIEVVARKVLNTAMGKSKYQPGNLRVYGNPGGRTILNRLDNLQAQSDHQASQIANQDSEIARQDSKIASQGNEISSQRSEIASQKDEIFGMRAQINALKVACNGYLNIRQRFLDTFRRDILKDPDARWTEAIGAGNKAAHHGDAVTDATLFSSDARKDFELMEVIYGLSHDHVLSLDRNGDQKSIKVLNYRATLKAGAGVPEDIEKAFGTFVSQLKENRGKSPTENPNSDLGRAYYLFWKIYREFFPEESGNE